MFANSAESRLTGFGLLFPRDSEAGQGRASTPVPPQALAHHPTTCILSFTDPLGPVLYPGAEQHGRWTEGPGPERQFCIGLSSCGLGSTPNHSFEKARSTQTEGSHWLVAI